MRGDPTGPQTTFTPFACPDAAPGGAPKKTLPVSTYILPACMGYWGRPHYNRSTWRDPRRDRVGFPRRMKQLIHHSEEVLPSSSTSSQSQLDLGKAPPDVILQGALECIQSNHLTEDDPLIVLSLEEAGLLAHAQRQGLQSGGG